jgi:1-phosphofructokinase family hexose kinase
MILTVTINPLLERRLSYKSISFNRINRKGNWTLQAGGKGINVSRQLKFLSTESFAFIFAGGNNGKLLKDILAVEKINFTSVKIINETRDCVVLIDETLKSVSSFFNSDPVIQSNEVKEFKLKLDKMIQNCEIVIFSGSSPCLEADSIFPFGIETANKYDKISLCDTYGRHLPQCLNASPTIVHNNLNEIENSLNISLQNEEDKINYLNDLYKKGIKQAYLTDGGNHFYASNFDYHYKIEVPEINYVDSTGSGDSFSAGVVYGWYNDLTFEETLIDAVSLGVLNAEKTDVCNITLDEIQKIKNKVKIIPVGKLIRNKKF